MLLLDLLQMVKKIDIRDILLCLTKIVGIILRLSRCIPINCSSCSSEYIGRTFH